MSLGPRHLRKRPEIADQIAWAVEACGRGLLKAGGQRGGAFGVPAEGLAHGDVGVVVGGRERRDVAADALFRTRGGECEDGGVEEGEMT